MHVLVTKFQRQQQKPIWYTLRTEFTTHLSVQATKTTSPGASRAANVCVYAAIYAAKCATQANILLIDRVAAAAAHLGPSAPTN